MSAVITALALYLIGAALPLAVLLGYYGWEAGRTGLDISEGEEMRAAAWLGVAWPLVLVVVALFAIPFTVAWTLRRFKKGKPDGRCDTDGHYMCDECVHKNPDRDEDP